MQALPDKPIAAIAPRMGRPPLGLKPTLVRLPSGMVERIDALCGQNRRAIFIREAVEEVLARREREKT
jgi:hypothetical protein